MAPSGCQPPAAPLRLAPPSLFIPSEMAQAHGAPIKVCPITRFTPCPVWLVSKRNQRTMAHGPEAWLILGELLSSRLGFIQQGCGFPPIVYGEQTMGERKMKC